MKVCKFILLVLMFCTTYYAKAQVMKKETPQILSKKEVNAFIESGEALFDSTRSNLDNAEVYRFKDGKLLYKRADGKGILWQSTQQIESTFKKASQEAEILSLRNWNLETDRLPAIKQQSLQTLYQATGKNIDFSGKSLALVSAIKIKNVIDEKELLYSVFYYSCEYFARKIDGSIIIEIIPETNNHKRLIVIDKKGRVYIPYSEYLKSFVEKIDITIVQSIEIESKKFELRSPDNR